MPKACFQAGLRACLPAAPACLRLQEQGRVHGPRRRSNLGFPNRILLLFVRYSHPDLRMRIPNPKISSPLAPSVTRSAEVLPLSQNLLALSCLLVAPPRPFLYILPSNNTPEINKMGQAAVFKSMPLIGLSYKPIQLLRSLDNSSFRAFFQSF